MQFCKDCGGVLNFFGKNISELCPSCLHQKKKDDPVPQGTASEDSTILADAILAVNDGKITLTSKEGWQLWSAPLMSEHHLGSLLKSAQLIYKIRSKRQIKS